MECIFGEIVPKPNGGIDIVPTERTPKGLQMALAPTNGHTSAGPLPVRARLNFVLIEPLPRVQTTIQLPEGVHLSDELQWGIVRDVGPGYHAEMTGTFCPTELKVGQKVGLRFPDRMSMGVPMVQVDGNKLMLVHEGEIAVVAREDGE